MGRPVYPYELGDPDFSWLISNFQENYPNYSFAESSVLPVVFIQTEEYEEIAVPEEILAEESLDEELSDASDNT